MVRLREREADILCNEWGVVIRTVAIKEAESAMLEMARTDTICSARCPHCGALNTFTGMSSVEPVICSACGEGVVVERSVQ
jgi:uncharacterized protein (DUF983 family)